jgi:hypothetical protein
MTIRDHIRNPAEWSVDQLRTTNRAVVMPMLAHATWHLYRKVVPR